MTLYEIYFEGHKFQGGNANNYTNVESRIVKALENYMC